MFVFYYKKMKNGIEYKFNFNLYNQNDISVGKKLYYTAKQNYINKSWI